MSEYDENEEYQAPFAELTDEELAREFRELDETETQALFTSSDPNVIAALNEWLTGQG
jgi:hypothetical protein